MSSAGVCPRCRRVFGNLGAHRCKVAKPAEKSDPIEPCATSVTKEQREALRALAAEVPPGPWRHPADDPRHNYTVLGPDGYPVLVTHGREFECEARAAYLAALSPEVLVALLDRIEALENALSYERSDHQETARLLHARTKRLDEMKAEAQHECPRCDECEASGVVSYSNCTECGAAL